LEADDSKIERLCRVWKHRSRNEVRSKRERNQQFSHERLLIMVLYIPAQ
jgi:hypothetical protein